MSEFTCDGCHGPILYMEVIAVVSGEGDEQTVKYLPSGNIMREPPTGFYHRTCWPQISQGN